MWILEYLLNKVMNKLLSAIMLIMKGLVLFYLTLTLLLPDSYKIRKRNKNIKTSKQK